MDIIALEEMRFIAGHGYYKEEGILRGEFLLDLEVIADVSEALEKDDLFKTVNYETLFYLCKQEMEKPAKLLETLAHRIIDRIEKQFEDKKGESPIEGIRLKIRKLNPPLDGQVGAASFEVLTGDFDIPSEKMFKKLADFLEENNCC